MSRSGLIGVHQWRTDAGYSSDSSAQLTSAILVSLIEGAGVSSEFYVAGAATPSSSMRWLTPVELINWGVVTGNPGA